MSQTGTEVRKGLDSHLWIAPLGTALPTPADFDTPMAERAGYVDLGFTAPEGETMQVDPTVQDHIPHQSFRPVRSDVTEMSETFAFTLWQRNRTNIELAFGGGTWTEQGGVYKYVPPGPAASRDKVFVLETIDGDIRDLWLCARGKPRLTSSITLGSKSDIASFEMEIKVLEHIDDEPWALLSNDSALAEVGS